MKKIFISLIVLLAILVPADSATAHVLITDETNTRGAILHIVPGDDPVAGQTATLFFDAEGGLWQDEKDIQLTITDSAGISDKVEVSASGNLATANYTFKTQGVYELVYRIDSGSQIYVFKHSQRVSRGAGSSALDRPVYAWAEALLVASGVAFIILLILFFNRRAAIAKQSKW